MKGLLFITHQNNQYDTLDSVRIALEGGCRQIQLRMKDAAKEAVALVGREAMALCKKVGAELYIDDHVDVCREVGAAGVHLGKLDMPPEQARTYLGKAYRIGGTANTFDDICRLAEKGVDYIGLGPFRFTETKKNLSPLLGLNGYRTILKRCQANGIRLPVLAIGGITPDDIPCLMETGISGIALSSVILQADDPVKKTREIVERMKMHESCY